MSLELVVLGCSGSYGAPAGGACSGYLVRSAGATLWVDCGNGTLANLQRHTTLEDLTGVVITHRHPDHCVDLLGLHVANRWGLGREGFPVFAAAQVRRHLEPLAGAFAETFAWEEVGDGDECALGDLTLRFSATDHPVPTVALEVTAGESRLVYTSDTAPGWSAADAFTPGPGLLLAEATYQDGMERGGAHLMASEAGAMAKAAGARRLMITHLWPTLDPSVSVAEAEEAFGDAVTLAAPHLSMRV